MPSKETLEQIDQAVRSHPVMLFMKGSPEMPQCGCSAQLVQVLASYDLAYATADVLAHPEIREGIKEYAKWPTIPQLYVNGEFVGGCDIVLEMHESGELGELLEKVTPREGD